MKVIYTNFLPKGTGGMALGPLVLIRPKYKEDQGIHAHEQLHVDQWRADRWGFHRKYLFNHDYRLNAEVDAYKLQIEVNCKQYNRTDEAFLNYYRNMYADFITTKYRLKVTKEEVINLLKS